MSTTGRWARLRSAAMAAVAVLLCAAVGLVVQARTAGPVWAATGDYNEFAAGGKCVSNWNAPGDSWAGTVWETIRSRCLLNTTPGMPVRIRLLVKGTTDGGANPHWYNFSFPVADYYNYNSNTDVSGWGRDHACCMNFGTQSTSGASGVDPFTDISPKYVGATAYLPHDNDTTNHVLTLATESYAFGDNASTYVTVPPGASSQASGLTSPPCSDAFVQAGTEVMWGRCTGATNVRPALEHGHSLSGNDPNLSDPPSIIADVCYDLTCTADHLLPLDWSAVPTGRTDPVFPGGDPTHVASDASTLPDGHGSDCSIDGTGHTDGKNPDTAQWNENVEGPLIYFACYFANQNATGHAKFTMWPDGHTGAPTFVDVPLTTGNYREPASGGLFYTLVVHITQQKSTAGYRYVAGSWQMLKLSDATRLSSGGPCGSTALWAAGTRSYGTYAPCVGDTYYKFNAANDGKAELCPNPNAVGACATAVGSTGKPVLDPGATAPDGSIAPTFGSTACSVGPWTFVYRTTPGTGSWSSPAPLKVRSTGAQAIIWDSRYEFRFQSTIAGASVLTVELGDEPSGNTAHVLSYNAPPDGAFDTGAFQFLRTGTFVIRFVCGGYNGSSTTGDLSGGSDTVGYPAQGPPSSGSSLTECLGNAFGGAAGFDLLDPSTWGGTLVSALNPVNYVRATQCVVVWAFVPTHDFTYYTTGVSNAYDASGLSSVQDAAETPFAAAEAFGNAANSGDCHGPPVQFPVAGATETLHPLESCSHSQMREVTVTAESVLLYVGGALVLARMFAAALGIKRDAIGAGDGGGAE